MISFDISPDLCAIAEEYLRIRALEGRIYPDDEVSRLPHASPRNPHRAEFELRARSAARLRRWLDRHLPEGRVLEVGCGNGWFLNQLIAASRRTGIGLDINLPELKQAAAVFRQSKIEWVRGDVFDPMLPIEPVDAVILASAVQYFADLPTLIDRTKDLLRSDGTLHFVDSPFYAECEVEPAHSRSTTYYTQRGVPVMANIYQHHTCAALDGCSWSLAYDPMSLINRLRRKLGCSVVPFPWILII